MRSLLKLFMKIIDAYRHHGGKPPSIPDRNDQRRDIGLPEQTGKNGSWWEIR
jgi:hypothetical protein